jgi:hypothetical protein
VKNWPALLAIEAGLALLLPILATGVSLALWSRSVDPGPIASVTETQHVEHLPAVLPVASSASAARQESAMPGGGPAAAPAAAREANTDKPVAAAAAENDAAEGNALALAAAVSPRPPDMSKSTSTIIPVQRTA